MNHSNDVLRKLDKINLETVEMHLNLKSYLLTGDAEYSGNFDSLIAILKKDNSNLKELTMDNPIQKELLEDLDDLISENILLKRYLTNDSALKDLSETRLKKSQLEITDKLSYNKFKIEQITNELRSNEISLLNNRSERADRSNSRVQNFIIITGIFTFFVIGLSLFISGKLIKNKLIAENLLIRSYEELEERVDSRTKELKDSNAKLSEEISEREKNEKFLRIQYDVSKTLAESESIKEASEKLLKNICGDIGWNFGILWLADDDKEIVSADYLWSEDMNETKIYHDMFSDSLTFPKGKGFPGSVFREGKSMWTKELKSDNEFIRKDAADKFGWNSRLGIPISNGKVTTAIIECFNRNSIEEKQDMIDVLESAGRQIGNFIERKKAEEYLRISNQQLEEKVKERTNELANALSKLIKESEEKEKIQNRIKLFAHTIRSIKDSIFIADMDNNIIFVNEEFKSTYGYKDENLNGREIPILKEIPVNLRSDILRRSMKEGWKGELITYRSDNTYFPTYLSTSSIKDDTGKAEAWVGICRDITELKENEELIIKRNNLLNLLNEVIRYTNSTFDIRSGIQYSIDKLCEYTHWQIGHCLLKNDESFNSSRIWNKDLDKKYLPFRDQSDTLNLEEGKFFPWDELKQGKAVWVSLSDLSERINFSRSKTSDELGLKTGIWIPIVINEKILGFLEFFKTEEEPFDKEILDCLVNIGVELGSLYEKLETINDIRNSEEDLKEAQSIAKVGSWDWDIKKNIITWSDEMYKIYGVNKKDFKLNYESYRKMLNPEYVDLAEATISRSIETKKPFSYFHKITTPSGTEKIIKAQGKVFLDENGEVIRMFGTSQDVTEIKKAGDELKKINDKLIETQRELIYNEKLAALGRFSSGIAHEIRNPLANINSLAQMVSKSTFDEKNSKKLEYILTNVEMANNIIKSLLDYASPEDLKPEIVDPGEMFKRIFKSIGSRIKNNGITFSREIPDDLPALRLDKLKIENAFLNFISNAIDAMPDGGMLTIRAFEDKENNFLNIDFIDTGVGIPPENHDKVLEPFFTTKDNGVGLGLGLAYQTIRLHEGEFKIISSKSKGTQISIKLPLNKNLN